MAKGIRWSRDELLVLLNLYEKLPFGQLDEAQPVIRELATRMGRTPGSVAMKLCNLASLDPAVLARGRKGLPGASALDRQVWAEFQSDREILAPASEQLFRAVFGAKDSEDVDVIRGVGVQITKVPEMPTGPTEAKKETTVRRGQQFFRQVVLNAFDGRCGVTGIPIRELLVASHILPWAKYREHRLDQQNGICLSRIHDVAFDNGLISFDENYCLLIGKRLRRHLPQEALAANFVAYEGKPLHIPNESLAPNLQFLAIHRKEQFDK